MRIWGLISSNYCCIGGYHWCERPLTSPLVAVRIGIEALMALIQPSCLRLNPGQISQIEDVVASTLAPSAMEEIDDVLSCHQ